MALFRGIQEYIALDANNITLVFDSGNIVNISGNIFLYPPQGHPILYNDGEPIYLGWLQDLTGTHGYFLSTVGCGGLLGWIIVSFSAYARRFEKKGDIDMSKT